MSKFSQPPGRHTREFTQYKIKSDNLRIFTKILTFKIYPISSISEITDLNQ